MTVVVCPVCGAGWGDESDPPLGFDEEVCDDCEAEYPAGDEAP